LYLQKDVTDLTDVHFRISGGKPGKKSLGFLTRSAVIMLCAAWERFNEDLLLEAIDVINRGIKSPNKLPIEVQKTISKKVTGHRHELKTIEMAGDGWKRLWRGFAEEETERFNTPKQAQLKELFLRYLGVSDFTAFWIPRHVGKIDKFVEIRGEIAHKGSQAQYVHLRQLQAYIEILRSNAIEIDRNMSLFLTNLIGLYESPWLELYPRTLEGYKNEPRRFVSSGRK